MKRRRFAVGSARMLIGAALACCTLASCTAPLPEAQSPPAKMYAARCGGCHRPHQPGALTPAMWKVQVARMDQKFREVQMPALIGPEREMILDYLTRNAAK